MSKKSLSLASFLLAATLTAAGPLSAAQPLSESRLDDIENYVRSQLDGNVVGYQLAIAQDGVVLRSYGYGKANLRKGKSMQPSYRLNIGSISKMITAVTVLKLAEMGYLDLDAPFTRYLRKSQFPDLHDSVRQITIRELLTYTSRLPSDECLNDCPEALQKPRKLQDCRVTLDVGRSPYRCSYAYQNANFHLLRLVIQGTLPAFKNVANPVDTTAELVALTHDLWLDEAGLDMDCDPDPSADMRYYTTCDLANYAEGNCLDESREGACECLDGTFFEYRAPKQSKFCSSGGWRASAKDLALLLARLRDGRILGPEMTGFLLDSTLEDGFGNPGSAVVGWNLPWSSYGDRNLGKAGGLHLLTAYTTLLPEGVTAALLINTKDAAWPPAPGVHTDAWDVLQEAWKGSLGPTRN